MLFLPAVGPLFPAVVALLTCWKFLLFVLLWTPLCTRLSRPVSASRADPRVHHRTCSHVLYQNFPAKRRTTRLAIGYASLPPHALSRATRGLGDPRPTQRKTPLSRLCASVIPELGWPPCRRHGRGFRRATCGPIMRVAGNASSYGVSASKVCTANCVLHLSSGFALLGFLRTCTRLLWIVVLPLRPPGCSPAEALFESAYDTHSCSCPRCVWLCASWSVGTSRRRHVRID